MTNDRLAIALRGQESAVRSSVSMLGAPHIVRGREMSELAPMAPLVLPMVMPQVAKSLSGTRIMRKKGSFRMAAMMPVKTTRMMVL